MVKVSLNDAFLARYISHDHTHNQCQVAAVGMNDRTTPNMDPGAFYSNLWSKMFFYFTENQLCQKYVILRPWRVHAKLKKASDKFVSSTFHRRSYFVGDFWG